MTIREAISGVKSGVNKVNADAHVSNKRAWNLLLKHSEWLVDRDSNQMRLGRKEDIFLNYKGAEIENIPTIDQCYEIVSGNYIKRTREKIPPVFEDRNGLIIKGVYSLDDSTSIERTTFEEYRGKKKNPWGRKTDKFYFYKDGYIYGDLPKRINVVALFKEDPELYNNCINCGDNEKCLSFLDSLWTTPKSIGAQVIDFVVKEIAGSLAVPNQEAINKNETRP
jgi:hypothetical protein